ncbi:hypothetical protein SUGI_0472350 [Cryptomeria japonica]|nr:hypothetical protein SUGI_0472350 [Cryptomeria japonica]
MYLLSTHQKHAPMSPYKLLYEVQENAETRDVVAEDQASNGDAVDMFATNSGVNMEIVDSSTLGTSFLLPTTFSLQQRYFEVLWGLPWVSIGLFVAINQST